MSFELDRIEELCNDRGWSHYRLAKEMDISPNSIGNLVTIHGQTCVQPLGQLK